MRVHGQEAAAPDPAPVTRRQVNELMRWGLDGREPSEPVAFFCECGDDHCYQPVWLTISEYDRLRVEEAWVALAERHPAGP